MANIEVTPTSSNVMRHIEVEYLKDNIEIGSAALVDTLLTVEIETLPFRRSSIAYSCH